jgi:hypothetical protein
MPVGSRYDALEYSAIGLKARVYKNNSAYDIYSAIRVEIYDDYTKAINGTNKLKTITAITKVPSQNGLYSYTLASSMKAGLYFDKFIYKPESSAAIETEVLPFYLRKTSQGASPPGAKETCKIVLNIYDILNTAECTFPIYVEMNEPYALYNSDIIRRERELFKTDKSGIATMYLLETDTLTASTGKDIYYTLTIPELSYRRNFTVPRGTFTANFFDLPVYSNARC